MRVDFIPKPLHWSPFSISISNCALKLNADQKNNMNYFAYLIHIIIAMIANDIRTWKTQIGRTGGTQENPVLKAGLSSQSFQDLPCYLQRKTREYRGPEVLDNIDEQRSWLTATADRRRGKGLKRVVFFFISWTQNLYMNLLQVIKNKGTYWSYNGPQFLIRSSFAYHNDPKQPLWGCL